jgi:aromatic ring hydroxylase
MQDLVVDGAMSDPKGDRGKRPKYQADLEGKIKRVKGLLNIT